MVLTADKDVALVVMDKDTHIKKCMTLLNSHKIYQECRDLTKTIHAKVIKKLTDLKNNLGQEFKNLYSNLCPLGTMVPLLESMDFPKSINLMSPSNP